MTLLEPIGAETKPAVAKPAWSQVTHRTGWILQANVSPLADLPPYDPDPDWTEAALAWSRPDDRPAGGSPIRTEATGDQGALPSGTPEKGELVLGVVRAKRAAQIVMRNHAQYNALVEKVIAAKGELTLKVRNEAPAVRFDPGLIVDLPAFAISDRRGEIATGRLCLTICMNESRSKIWNRTSSVNDAAWGSGPCEQLNNLVDTSRAWFEAYAQLVMDLYARNISEALLTTGEKHEINVDLTVRNRFELISGDTELTGLGRLSAAVANGEDISQDEPAREAAQRLDAIVRCVQGMGLEKDGVLPILRPVPTTFDGNRYFFVSHRTARGFRGAYAVNAQQDKLLFAGIATTDPDPYVTVERLGEPTRPVANSPSQHVTAELANTVAKYF
jgi:hypothetical protein